MVHVRLCYYRSVDSNEAKSATFIFKFNLNHSANANITFLNTQMFNYSFDYILYISFV